MMLLLPLTVGTTLLVAGTAATPSDHGFRAVWNCPYWMNSARSSTAMADYGITANPSGSFNGSAITLFYGPNTWPVLKAARNPAAIACWENGDKAPCTWNQSLIWSNFSVQVNGGVPQAGDVELHKAAVAALVEALIPDSDFAGYGIFDMEGWRALYNENYDSLSYSNAYSALLVQKAHPDWTNATQIEAEAESQYNAGSQLFFSETLKTAQHLRPKGKFGFYEYPMEPASSLLWLWQAVGVLTGTDYGRTQAVTAESVNNSLIAAAMVEAAGGPRPDIATYVWLWPGAVPVSSEQLTASVIVPAALGADIVMWGSSSDAHVNGYDPTIAHFLKTTVGPLIKQCTTHTTQCAATKCSGHGRCSSYDPKAPENGCKLPFPADLVCLCDQGWKKKDCSQQAAPAANVMLSLSSSAAGARETPNAALKADDDEALQVTLTFLNRYADTSSASNPLAGLPALPKVHHSWPIASFKGFSKWPKLDVNNPLLLDYARITHALPLDLNYESTQALTATAVHKVISICAKSNASLSLNWSPFISDTCANGVCRDPRQWTSNMQKQIDFFRSQLTNITAWLKQANTARQAGTSAVAVGAILIDQEAGWSGGCANRSGRVDAKDPTVIGMTFANNKVFDTAKEFFPAADVEQYGRGEISRCSGLADLTYDPIHSKLCWVSTSWAIWRGNMPAGPGNEDVNQPGGAEDCAGYTLLEKGDSFNPQFYTLGDSYGYGREGYNRTVISAIARESVYDTAPLEPRPSPPLRVSQCYYSTTIYLVFHRL